MVRTRGGCELPRSCVLRQAVRIKQCAGLCVHRRGIACGMLADLHAWCVQLSSTPLCCLPWPRVSVKTSTRTHSLRDKGLLT